MPFLMWQCPENARSRLPQKCWLTENGHATINPPACSTRQTGICRMDNSGTSAMDRWCLNLMTLQQDTLTYAPIISTNIYLLHIFQLVSTLYTEPALTAKLLFSCLDSQPGDDHLVGCLELTTYLVGVIAWIPKPLGSNYQKIVYIPII